MIVSMDKKYLCKGSPARILAVGIKAQFQVVAVVTQETGDQCVRHFTSEGRYYGGSTPSCYDLVEHKEYYDFSIDDRVMVRMHEKDNWTRRFFAGINEKGFPLAFLNGTSSWTYGTSSAWKECRKPLPHEL